MRIAPQLYLGHVMHRRLRPARNAFVYPVFYVTLPLRHLPACDSGIFSVEKANLLSFRSRDHGARDGSPLLPWIESRLADAGLPQDGEIMLQTFPRVCGMVFNPVSFWYCHDRSGALIAVLAEVNNTFGGHHHYLLHHNGMPLQDGEELHARKVFHVSPFNEVCGGYRFRFNLAQRTPRVCIDYDDEAGTVLETAICGSARGWSPAALLGAFLRMPLMTAGVVFRIHWQAIRLLLRRVPFHGARVSSPAPENRQ